MSLSPWPCITGVSLLPAISCRGSEDDRVGGKGVGRGAQGKSGVREQGTLTMSNVSNTLAK